MTPRIWKSRRYLALAIAIVMPAAAFCSSGRSPAEEEEGTERKRPRIEHRQLSDEEIAFSQEFEAFRRKIAELGSRVEKLDEGSKDQVLEFLNDEYNLHSLMEKSLGYNLIRIEDVYFSSNFISQNNIKLIKADLAKHPEISDRMISREERTRRFRVIARVVTNEILGELKRILADNRWQFRDGYCKLGLIFCF